MAGVYSKGLRGLSTRLAHGSGGPCQRSSSAPALLPSPATWPLSRLYAYAAVQARALEKGLMLLTCGVYANVIRFLFPLTIPEPVFHEGLSILESVLTA